MADNLESQKAVAKPASHAKNDYEKDKFILRQLVTKDFKIKYRRSVLGVNCVFDNLCPRSQWLRYA